MIDETNVRLAVARSTSKWFPFWCLALLSIVAMLAAGFAVKTGSLFGLDYRIVAVLAAMGLLVGCGVLILVRFTRSIVADSERNSAELLEANQLLRAEVKERKRAEGLYELLAERISDVIWTADMQFNWTYVSPSIEGLCGFTSEEIRKRSIADVLTSDSAEMVRRMMHGMLEQSVENPNIFALPVTLEVEYNCKDSSTVWTEVNASFVLDGDGSPVGVIGISRNIAARKTAEAKLCESERAIATLMGNLPGMVYRCLNDKNWTVEFVSEGSYALTGYRPAELEGNRVVAHIGKKFALGEVCRHG